MQTIQAASFSIPDFDDVRGDYVTALRSASADPDPDVRQTALGTLSQEDDSFAQKVLLDGLKDDTKALVPPTHALQMLAYSRHAGVYTAAREIFDKSGDSEIRGQALRVMSTDPESVKTIQKALGNKKESAELRRQCAAVLHALNPKALQTWASKAVLDETEHQDVVATGLTAMYNFGDEKAIRANRNLAERVSQLKSKGPAATKRQAKEFLNKYGFE
ncbi:MAG: HEAT repeat domain-containing protein [Acidobacteria bacterium]|nr:HEAT repeat domain-containing protein [Acidobacteriota bacterium]